MLNLTEWTSLGFLLVGRMESAATAGYSVDGIVGHIFPMWKLGYRLHPDPREVKQDVMAPFGVPSWAEDIVAQLIVRKMRKDPRYMPPDYCSTREALRDLIALTRVDMRNRSDLMVVEVGVRNSMSPQIKKSIDPTEYPDPTDFCEHPGRAVALGSGNRMHPAGQPIGFELFTVENSVWLTWRHWAGHKQEIEIEKNTNGFGLFDAESHAGRAVRALGWDAESWDVRDENGVLLDCPPVFNLLVMRHSTEEVMRDAPSLPPWERLLEHLLNGECGE